MFKLLLNTSFFNDEVKLAKKTFISEDRKEYYPIFDNIKCFLQNYDDVIFSSITKLHDFYSGKKVKKKEPVSYTETELIIYTPHSRKMTTLITNQIHKKYNKFVQMRSIIPNKEYVIMYNLRPLIKINNIHRYKKVELVKLFNTVNVDNLLYFPAEVELMDIYHKLYLPNFYDEWERLENEKIQMSNVNGIQKYNKINKKIVKYKKCDVCQESRNFLIDNIKLIMLEYFHNENIVLVGEWAQYTFTNKNLTSNTNFLSQTDPKTKKRNTFPVTPLQIISENPIEIDYKNIEMYLSKHIKYGMYYKKSKLYVPKNNRIHKHTIFIKFPIMKTAGVDKSFLEIYNCGSYELIPYMKYSCKINNPINLKIGCRYIFIYILLVEIWIINLLYRLETLDKNIYNDKISIRYNMIAWAKKNIPVYTKDYLGINYDEKIYKRLVISANQIIKTSYYPEKYIKTHKKYNSIATSS
jgi:hypothetical protein